MFGSDALDERRSVGQTWMTVEGIRANINEDGGVDRWQVTIEVAFKVDLRTPSPRRMTFDSHH